jgi:uncharacterized membrane protein YkvA (DUF1232 family)
MGSINDLISKGRLVWRLLNDARVPSWIKVLIPLLVLFYFVAPVDFIPDFIPVFGQLDDLGVLLIGMNLIIRFAPQHVVDEHRLALGYDTYTSSGSSAGTGSTSNGTNSGQPTRKVSVDSESIEGEYKVVRPRESEYE